MAKRVAGKMERLPYDSEPPKGKPFITQGGIEICGAWCKGNRRCNRIPTDNGRCTRHGGSKDSHGNIVHRTTALKTGVASKTLRDFMPARLVQKAEALANDKAAECRLQNYLIVLDSLLATKLEQLSEDAPTVRWHKAAKAFRKFRGAFSSLGAEQKVLGEQLEKILLEGEIQAALELDIRALMQEGAGLVKVDLARQQIAGEFISERQMNLLLTALTLAVHTQIEDVTVRHRIQSEFDRILAEPPKALQRAS